MSYENKILQLKNKLGKKKTTEQKQTFQKPPKPFYCNEWEQEGLTMIENDFGVVFKRQVRYPNSYKHGLYELQLFNDAIHWWEAQKTIDHPYAICSDDHIVFFDTETTGLKGVGTHIFLFGFLEIEKEQFVLNQYVLADPSNEAALLFETKLWEKQKTFITYNGKSFDWPQVETRWTLNRHLLPKLQQHKQVDLLHSSKRMWKNNMKKLKLSSVEEEKLGFKRKNDIPGFLAPIIYADAIKSGNPSSLMKVLHHNEYDLLSLVTLYIHSTKLLLEQNIHESAVTYTNIGKWYGDLKQNDISEEVLTNIVETYDSNTEQAYYHLAFHQKRNKQYVEAIDSFKKSIVAIDFRKKLDAFEQIAMICEHRVKNLTEAYQYTIYGIEFINNEMKLNEERKQKMLEKWLKRKQRLQNKMDK